MARGTIEKSLAKERIGERFYCLTHRIFVVVILDSDGIPRLGMASFIFKWTLRLLVVIGLISIWQWMASIVGKNPPSASENAPYRMNCSEIHNYEKSIKKINEQIKRSKSLADMHNFLHINYFDLKYVDVFDEAKLRSYRDFSIEVGDLSYSYFPDRSPCSFFTNSNHMDRESGH